MHSRKEPCRRRSARILALAPMSFEIPFDLIVMARINPLIPIHPML
jgi:hypothetical protein